MHKPSIKIAISLEDLLAYYLKDNFPQYVDKHGHANFAPMNTEDMHGDDPEAVLELVDSGKFREVLYVNGYCCNATIGNTLIEEAAGKDMRLAFEFGTVIAILDWSPDYKPKEKDDK